MNAKQIGALAAICERLCVEYPQSVSQEEREILISKGSLPQWEIALMDSIGSCRELDEIRPEEMDSWIDEFMNYFPDNGIDENYTVKALNGELENEITNKT